MRLDGVDALRELLCNVLHYDYADDLLPTRGWPDSLKGYLADRHPKVVADQNGFQIVYLRLQTDRVLRTHERELVQRIIRDVPTFRGLVVASDVNQREWELVNVKFAVARARQGRVLLRRMPVGPGQKMRTPVDRLVAVDINVLGEQASSREIQDAHDTAFDVQAVTKEFFRQLTTVFSEVEAAVEGFGTSDADQERRRLFTQQFFNRLMFIAFIQKKGWLTVNDSSDYLDELWNDYRKKRTEDGNFYDERLRLLFFHGLNNPGSVNITGINRGGFLKNFIGIFFCDLYCLVGAK